MNIATYMVAGAILFHFGAIKHSIKNNNLEIFRLVASALQD
jgi:hypothetical protein